MSRLAVLFLLFLLPVVFKEAGCSAGDNAQFFQDCQRQCIVLYACPEFKHALKWTQEPCFHCRQKCIWETVSLFQENHLKIPQFFGKWPFVPFSVKIGKSTLNIQEPASTIFSLLNLVAVWNMYQAVKEGVDKEYRIKNVWKGYAYVGAVVWMFSASFHSRDFWLTEYFDYFAACGIVCYAFFAAMSFTVPWFQHSRQGFRVWLLVGMGTLGFYVAHVYSLLSNFDYGLNMAYCVSISFVTAAIYIVWIAREIVLGRNRHSLWVLAGTLAISLGSAVFELFDFPPIFWIFDAHSLFHAATIPTPLFLARFIIEESHYEMGHRKFLLRKNI